MGGGLGVIDGRGGMVQLFGGGGGECEAESG